MKKAPDFNSFLCEELKNYVDFMVGNGRSFRVEITLLKEFDRFLQTQTRQEVDADCVDAFVRIKSHLSDEQYAKRHRVIRKFIEHRAIRGRGEPILAPPKTYSGGKRIPYFYTDSDISRLIADAGELTPTNSLRPHTFQIIIGLLCCTGMRISEALNLDIDDVDLDNCVLYIRNTKFKKSRYVPIHQTACAALKCYTELKGQYFPIPKDRAFFLSNKGGRIAYATFNSAFNHLIRRTGIGGDGRNSRTHDLRHTFAVNRLLAWYEEGADIHDRLPELSTYMGHAKFEDTTHYLNASAELMAKGATRFQFRDRGDNNA